MRFFYLLLTLILMAGLIGPFFLKGPTGQPLITVDDVIEDTPLERPPTPVYRWRDASGTWQFGEAPPDGVDAELMTVDTSRVTPLGSEWNVRDQAPSSTPPPGQFDFDSPLDAYRKAPDILDAAQKAADAMSERTRRAEEALPRHR